MADSHEGSATVTSVQVTALSPSPGSSQLPPHWRSPRPPTFCGGCPGLPVLGLSLCWRVCNLESQNVSSQLRVGAARTWEPRFWASTHVPFLLQLSRQTPQGDMRTAFNTHVGSPTLFSHISFLCCGTSHPKGWNARTVTSQIPWQGPGHMGCPVQGRLERVPTLGDGECCHDWGDTSNLFLVQF